MNYDLQPNSEVLLGALATQRRLDRVDQASPTTACIAKVRVSLLQTLPLTVFCSRVVLMVTHSRAVSARTDYDARRCK